MQDNCSGMTRLSPAAMAGAICVVLFAGVMLWWLVDPDLSDDWFSAPTPWKGRFDSYIKPAGFAALTASTCLGWIAVWNIRHSSGRRSGLVLAVFDGLVLPLLLLDTAILFLWAFADKALASWRGLDGSMFRNVGEFALWAILVGTTIGSIDYLIIRLVWRRATHNLTSPVSTPEESARRPGHLRRVAIVIGLGAIVLVPLIMSVSEHNRKGRFGYPVRGGEVHYRIFEANASLLDSLVPIASRQDGFNRAPRTRDVAAARNKAQTAELDEAALSALFANASTNSGLLADEQLAGMEIWRTRDEAWTYHGKFGSGSGQGALRLTEKDQAIQLGARYHVRHQSPGAPSPLTTEIAYQGEAPPPEGARAFMVPFTRGGRDVYLVITFEVK